MNWGEAVGRRGIRRSRNDGGMVKIEKGCGFIFGTEKCECAWKAGSM
jgi:hypothetical protein